MVEDVIAEHFANIGHTWTVQNLKGERYKVQPTDEDVQIVLDEAAKQLYTCEVGTRLNIGGLIVEKTETGHEVYAYVGYYT